MNAAELHLVVNHAPIFTLIIGFFILLFGVFRKSGILRTTAYTLFIVAAISAIASVSTGEEAEEIIEKAFPEISHDLIHDHEEKAETARTICLLQGIISILALYFKYRRTKFETLISYILLVIALASCFYLIQASSSGGEIMHPEIRSDFKLIEN